VAKKLKRMLPESVNTPKRESVLQFLDFVYWVKKNRPEVYKDVLAALGKKEIEDATKDLNKFTSWWR